MAFDFSFLDPDKNNQEEEATSVAKRGMESRKKNRRNRIERANYDRMQKAERQKLALEKLQSDEFQETLKRYYSGGITDINNSVTGGKNINDFTKEELIEKFYQDRIWSEYNTIGIVNDVGQVLARDEQYKGDWAEITQVYADLPYFGSQTIGFTKWAKDFIPALIVDPINLYTLGTGKVVAREASKVAINELTKKQFQLNAAKQAAINIGIKEGTIGATVGGGADLLRQTAEIDAGLMSDYNVTRTLIASGAGGVAQGTIGASMSAWSAKGKAGKFYDKGDGFKGDYDRDFGLAGSEADTTFTGKSGKVKTVKNKINKKEAPKQATDKPNQIKTINTKINEIKRQTPIINLDKIKADEPHNIIVKEVKEGIDTLIKEGKVRTTQRVNLLQKIKEKGEALLGKENSKLLDKELKLASKMAPNLASTVYAGRINWLLKSKEISELKKLMDEAVDVNEKLAVSQELIKAMKERNVLIKNHVETVQASSDVMNQQKLIVEVDEADKTRMMVDKILAEQEGDLLNNVNKLKPNEKIKIIENLAEISNNPFLASKLIKQVDRKSKEKNVSFAEALNEYTTANLLFDPTTHEVNILSTGVNYQKIVLEQYTGGLLNFIKGNRRQGLNQISMATDLFTSQLRFFQIALRKAKLSWKANRAIGDNLEHRFDGRQQRNMETYLAQLQESDNIFAKSASKIISPISKLAYTSLRLLGAGDTLTKNMLNRAARVAVVNQRMRTFYPELWKKRKRFNKGSIVALQDKINDVRENIKFEQSLDKPSNKKIDKLHKELKTLEQQKIKQTPFEQKWSELYYQYEDDFGNFRETKTFNAVEMNSLDDLSKSVANDPAYIAQSASFTQNLKSKLLDANKFYPDQQQSKFNIGQGVLDFANRHPATRILTSIHFVKTPVNLFKTAWQMTPALNKLNLEYRAMQNASDPVVRNKAQAIAGLGGVVYGYAMYLAFFTDRLTGSEPKDPKHKFAYKMENDDGTFEYVSLKRFFPLSVPFMVAASIRDMANKAGDIWTDKYHSPAQAKIIEFGSFIGGSSMSLWSNIFASNLMTQDFFKLTEMFSQTNVTTEEGMSNISKIQSYLGRSTSKLIPAATAWRWTNKVFAEAEAELVTMLDHIEYSTPYGLAKIIDEKYLGNKFNFENWGDDLSPRRDPLKNVYPKTEGLLLGKAQDVFPTTKHWSANMVDSNGKPIVLSKQAKEKLATSNIKWERPAALIDVGMAKSLNMRKTEVLSVKDPITNVNMELKDGTTLYEAMLQIAGKIKINDQTLNERFKDELENPNSLFNTRYSENRLIAGKYEADDYLLSIIREHEAEAREWIKGYALIELQGKPTTIESFKQEVEEGIEQLYQ